MALSSRALPLLFLLLSISYGKTITKGEKANICVTYCDGRDPTLVNNARVAVSVQLFSRNIELRVSDSDNMAHARISNGDPGDEVWIDRSFNAGASWSDDSRLGSTAIPEGQRQKDTLLYNIDNPQDNFKLGLLRACGKVSNRDEIACTSWARSTVYADAPVDAAATAMMQFYNDGGLWSTTGWWNSANCLTSIIDYIRLSGKTHFTFAIDKTFELNKDKELGDFTNEYIDDVGWWGLAFVDAFDLLKQQKYLDMAQKDADFMYATRDDHCGGGVWWTTRKDYKNAIPNELFIKLAAAIHNRIPGDTKYLNQAIEVYNWFERSGMINSENLINDGLTDDCENNLSQTWTYNQGVIVGGLVELERATGDSKYLTRARQIADATLASSLLNPGNILFEPCEFGGGDCGGDGPSFKGIFIRNLGELNRRLSDRPYSNYLTELAMVLYQRDRNSANQYGVHFAGPFTAATAATQHSALDVFNAAI